MLQDIGFADLPEETEEADLLIESVDVGKKKSKKKNLPSHEEEATSLAQAALGNDDSQAVAVDRKNDEDGSVLSSEPGNIPDLPLHQTYASKCLFVILQYD